MFTCSNPILRNPKGFIKITKPLPKGVGYFDVNRVDLEDTVLDPRLSDKGGVIPLISNALLYISDHIRTVAPNLPGSMNPEWVKKSVLDDEHKDLVFKVKRDSYLYIPEGINNSFKLVSEMMILGDLQRAANALIEAGRTYRRSISSPWGPGREAYQRAFDDFLKTAKDELLGKGGMLDCLVASVIPFTMRGVLVNDAFIRPDQVKLPWIVAKRWLSFSEFRESYGIDDKNPESLNGLPVLVGRQPTHRYTNLFSLRIIVSNKSQTSVGINPLVVNLFDGDFDGDTVHLWMPLTPEAKKEVREILPVSNLLSMSKPGKEFKGIVLDPKNSAQQSRDIMHVFMEGELLGKSCTWRDLIGEGKDTGYYSGIKKAEFDQFASWARGEHGISFDKQSEAMLDYRIIKVGVARAGGLSNSIQAMCLAYVWNWKDQDKASTKMRLVGDLKHALCQEMLDAKHGGKTEQHLETLAQMFYAPDSCEFTTAKEYKQFMIENANLPEEPVNFVIDIFFKLCNPPQNINDVCKKVNPAFVMTRRQGDMNLMDAFSADSQGAPGNLHSMFIFRDKNTGETQ